MDEDADVLAEGTLMKVVSYNEGAYSSQSRWVVELDSIEINRLITDVQIVAIKRVESHIRLGMEIDCSGTFDRQDEKSRKAGQLDSLMRSITEAKTLVFPEEPARP